MYAPEQHFLWAIDDLREFVSNPSPKNLIAAAAKVRHLLTDGPPLLHQVNQTIRMKVWFEIVPHRPLPPEIAAMGVSFHHQAMSPIGMPEHFARKKMSLDNFLAHTAANLKGRPTSTLDVIKYVANYGGGIHKAPPDTETTRNLEEAAKLVLSETPSVLHMVKDIAQVVIVAYTPLYLRIRSEVAEPG
jgi:hypothetical protein